MKEVIFVLNNKFIGLKWLPIFIGNNKLFYEQARRSPISLLCFTSIMTNNVLLLQSIPAKTNNR